MAPLSSLTQRRRTQLLGGVAAATLVVDLLSKAWAVVALDDRDIDIVWKLRLHLVANTGFAFSKGEGLGPLLGLVAIVIAAVLWRSRRKIVSGTGSVALGLVMGGALGNLVDRVFRGEGWGRGAVVDFIDVQFWPVFNVADAAIVVGVGLLMLHFWREDRRHDPAPDETDIARG